MADIDSALRQWSTTASNNKPTGATSIGSGLDDNLRQMQATVRQYLGSIGTTIASAATVDLSTADGKTIPVSGTSTVTGMGTEAAGLEYLLTTTGAQVWVHSTALQLPGAVNITTAAGDYALVQSKGSGNWVVPFFTKASGQPIIAGTAGSGVTVSGASIALDINGLGATTVPLATYSMPVFSADTSANRRATIASILAGAAATQTQMESYTSNSVVATPGNMNWHPGMAKAWLRANASSGGITLMASYNISAITRAATGNYVVNFVTPFSSANYVGIVNSSGSSALPAGNIATASDNSFLPTASVFKFSAYKTDTGAAVDPDRVYAVFYGDQ